MLSRPNLALTCAICVQVDEIVWFVYDWIHDVNQIKQCLFFINGVELQSMTDKDHNCSASKIRP